MPDSRAIQRLGLVDGRRAWTPPLLPTLKSCKRCGGTWRDGRFPNEGSRCRCWRDGFRTATWAMFCNFGRRRPRSYARLDLSAARI